MKRQLKGSKNKLGKDKWELIVNLGYNSETKRYERKYKTFYGNSRESDVALREFLYELENPILLASEQPLREWLYNWLENYSKPNHEQTTYKRAERIIRNNINPYIGHIPLGELTTDHIQSMYEILIKEGKIIKKKNSNGETQINKSPLAPRTVRYVHTILHQALDQAVDREKILENPSKKAKPPKDKENAPEKWVVLSASELNAFLEDELCKAHRDYPLIFTAAYSGARQSELLGLTKNCILWNKSAIRIEKSLHKDEDSEDGFERKSRTKNKWSNRTIRLSEKAMQVLENHLKCKEVAKLNNPLVFTEPDDRPISRNNLAIRYSRIAEKLGYPDMTFHHLRHTHATILLTAGAYINDVSRRLGHASPIITLSTYGHCLPQGDDILVNKLDELLQNQK